MPTNSQMRKQAENLSSRQRQLLAGTGKYHSVEKHNESKQFLEGY